MRAALLALLLALPAGAERPINPPAPDIPPGLAWLNATNLSLSRLRGRKAVIVAFINPTSANSLRAVQTLKAWFDRYALHQVMVVGVVTPELDAHRDPVWVKDALARQGVEFPVVLDSDRRIWNAYANEGWPAMYLVAPDGRIVHDRLGEGGYQEFERELRAALAPLVREDALPKPVDAPEPKLRCGGSTAEIPFGARRSNAKALALDQDFSRRRSLIVESRDGEKATLGRWDAEPDGLRLAQKNARQGAFVRVVYRGAQALAVLAPSPEGPTRVFVKQDDLWLHEGIAGRDIRFDDDGRSYAKLDGLRLYDLVRDPDGQPHELYLVPDRMGAGVISVSFSDACSVTDLP